MDGDVFELEVLEAEGMEGEGFESEGMEAEGFEAQGADALDDAFAEAMAAQDEDEFMRTLTGALKRARPALPNVGQRALPFLGRLLQTVGPVVSGLLGADAMDGFADAAADYANDDDMEAFTRVLGGLAGRHVVRSTIPPARRRQQPQQARALGRAVGQMTTRVARNLTRRFGARALPAVTRIVREVTRQVRQQGASPQAVPRMIRRIGGRVIASPRAVRRLARPNPAARQLRVSAGIRRPGIGAGTGIGTGIGTRPRMTTVIGRRGQRWPRTIVLRGPVRIVVR